MLDAYQLRFKAYRLAVREVEYMISMCPHADLARAIQTHCHLWPYKNTSSALATALYWRDLISLKNPDRDFSLILKTFDILIDVHPDNIWLRRARARLLWGIDYFAAAKQDLEHALSREPDDFASLQLMGETLWTTGKYHEALSYVNAAIKQDAFIVRGYLARAIIYSSLAENSQGEKRKNYYALALSDIEKAALLQPSVVKDETIKRLQRLIKKL